MKRRSSRRQALAMGLVACAHLILLTALGWRFTKPSTLWSSGPSQPVVQLTILRLPRPVQAAASKPKPPAKPSPSSPPIGLAAPNVLTQPAPAGQAPAPGAVAATGPPDCEPEDLPLLTASELALCRVALDGERERRLARGAAEKAAKQVTQAQSTPHMYRMDADKEASYAAAAKANEELGKPPAMAVDRTPSKIGGGSHIGVGVTCSHTNIPLLSGVETNPNLFAKRHKEERPAHGPSPCSVGLR